MNNNNSKERKQYLSNAQFMLDAVQNYLSSNPSIRRSNEPNNNTFWVIVKPWHGSAVPWYSITLGLMLKKHGHNVTILWDDLIDNPHEVTWNYENEAIHLFLSNFHDIPFQRLSSFNPKPLLSEDHSFITTKALASAIWINRSSLPKDIVHEKQNLFVSYFEHSYPLIKSFMTQAFQSSDRLIIPGGVYGNTALFAEQCSIRSFDFFTYDGGTHEVSIGINAPAAYFPSISDVVNSSKHFLSPTENTSINQFVKNEITDRMFKKDDYLGKIGYADSTIQRASLSDDQNEYEFDVLFPLCIEWDSTALGRHQFFLNDVEWIIETIGFLLEKTSSKIAVRQHPGERVKPGVGNHIAILLDKKFGNHPRLRFFSSEENVSSYKILENCSLILPSVSSFANEAAVLGKTVITECKSYFSSGDFSTFISTSKNDYFSKIASYLSNPLSLSENQKNEACKYYFFFLCRHTWGDFSPSPDSFSKWVKIGINEILNMPQAKQILNAIVNKQPISRQVYKDVLNKKQISG